MIWLFTEYDVAQNSHVLHWNFSIPRATSYSVNSQATVAYYSSHCTFDVDNLLILTTLENSVWSYDGSFEVGIRFIRANGAELSSLSQEIVSLHLFIFCMIKTSKSK